MVEIEDKDMATPVAMVTEEDYIKGLNSTQRRALDFLSAGQVSQMEVAQVCGVTDGYISQLMSDSRFSEIVARKRYDRLSKLNKLDEDYTDVEDRLLKKLRNTIPMLTKPGEIANVLRVINSATRRGVAAPQNSAQVNNVVVVTLPTVLRKKLIIEEQTNKVLEADDVSLITANIGSLENAIKKEDSIKELDYEPARSTGIANISRFKKQTISAEDL